MSRRRSRRRIGSRPFVGFLLVASFGILFAGCNGPESVPEDDFVFTQDDVTRFRDMADDAKNASGAVVDAGAVDALVASGALNADEIVLDLSQSAEYASIRDGGASDEYQVTNVFLNVRQSPSTGSPIVARLDLGAKVDVLGFIDAEWVKVKAGTVEGYAAHRYLAKTTSDEKLAAEKKEFEGTYYVSFGFVNMRAQPLQGSEKLAEIPGDFFLKPTEIENGWAKVSYEGKEGYVSTDFIAPFEPNFIVRQDIYELPVLHYRLTADGQADTLAAIARDVAALKADGFTFITFANVRDVLLAQQTGDARLEEKRAIVAVSGITPDNVRALSDALYAIPVPATLFIETRHIGIAGITEKRIVTLMANGFDIQSGTHTGDDMRALTNAQAELELKQSRKMLEELTKKPVFAVAFPQGGTNDRIGGLAAEAGYLFGVSDGSQRSYSRSQFLRIPAMTVFPSTSGEDVAEFVRGE